LIFMAAGLVAFVIWCTWLVVSVGHTESEVATLGAQLLVLEDAQVGHRRPEAATLLRQWARDDEDGSLARLADSVDQRQLSAAQQSQFATVTATVEAAHVEAVGRLHSLRDGQRVLAILSLVLAGGMLLLGIVLWRELRQRHEDHKLISTSEQRYRRALDLARGGVWEFSPDTDQVLYTPGWFAVVGIQRASTLDDWLSRLHPADRVAFLRSIAAVTEGRQQSMELEHRLRADDGSTRWIRIRAVVREADDPEAGLIGAVDDVTQHQSTRERALRAERLDPVTGLELRASFEKSVTRAMETNGGAGVAVIRLAADDLPRLHTTFGRKIGEAYQRGLAQRLTRHLRPTDIAGWFDGAFAVMLWEPGTAPRSWPRREVDQLVALMGEPIQLESVLATPRIAAGVLKPQEPMPSDEVLRRADVALDRCRASTARCAWYRDTMGKAAERALRLEADLMHAADRDQLVLYFQPIVRLPDGRIKGVEALVRWSHPEFGLIAPGEFIPLAENSGTIREIGRWVLDNATVTIQSIGELMPDDTFVAVNVSALQFAESRMVEEVATALARSGLPALRLEIELTESALMGDLEEAQGRLAALRQLGVRISVDDFGTGYSSLSYLQQLPLDVLKIDRAFVKDIESGHDAIVRAIVSMSAALGLDVIAEGIETPGQLDTLTELGCKLGQGHHFARAMPVSQLIPWLRPANEDVRLH